MLVNLAIAFGLLALTVLIHAFGLALILRHLRLPQDPADLRFGPCAWLLIQLAGWTVLIHCVEILVWALFYWWQNCLPDFESTLYFTIVTYTTVGYGDLVLGKEWRLLAGIEALTGILMCGWSTGFFFAVVSRLVQAQSEQRNLSEPSTPS